MLASDFAPRTFDDIIGDKRIISVLSSPSFRRSVILWGPPGIGKTSLAKVYALKLGWSSISIRGQETSTDELRSIIYRDNVVLMIDELQYLSKKQQQLVLAPIETGKIILIATTTENPYGYVFPALRSRCAEIRLREPTAEEIKSRLVAICVKLLCFTEEGVLESVADNAHGDVRSAIDDLLELVAIARDNNRNKITQDDLSKLSRQLIGTNIHIESYKSALQKSIRGSDPDASVIYALTLLENGELESVCRRLRVIVSEDIGLAVPMAVASVTALIENALHLGMPEAAYPITQAVLYLALLPKSNSVARAIGSFKALGDREVNPPKTIDRKNSPYYKYPHDYQPYEWVPQQYLPDGIIPGDIYSPGQNKNELAFASYWRNVHERYGSNNNNPVRGSELPENKASD